MRRLTAFALLLSLVAVACKIETNVVATLEADGSGTVMFEGGFDDEAQDLFLQDTDPFDEAPPGATTSQETRGDLQYFQFALPFSSAEELAQLLLESDQAPFETFSASFSPESVTVSATTGSEGGGFFDSGDLEGIDADTLEESISANIVITMPGRIVSSNADETDGSTLTWKVPLFGGALDLQAESNPSEAAEGGDGGGALVPIIIVIVLLAAAVGVFLVSRNRSGSSSASTEAAIEPATDEATQEDTPPAE